MKTVFEISGKEKMAKKDKEQCEVNKEGKIQYPPPP
jgi:hypothetical protein